VKENFYRELLSLKSAAAFKASVISTATALIAEVIKVV